MEEFRKIRLISDTGFTIDIAEDADDYCLDQDGLDLGVVNGAHNMTQFIDLIGQHMDSTVLSPRDISIIGWIIGDSLDIIKKRKQVLDRAVNPLYYVRLEYGDYSLDFKPDASIQYSTAWKENNAYMAKFQIQGTAPMPLFKLKTSTIYRTNVDMQSSFRFPLIIDKAKGVKLGYYPASIRAMPNDGDVASGMLISLTAKGGNVVNPSITNMNTNQRIDFMYTLTDGDTLLINTELGNQYVKLVKGSLETNAIKYISIASDIDMVLEVGFNRVIVDATSGADFIDTRIEFSPRFLEIEGRTS